MKPHDKTAVDRHMALIAKQRMNRNVRLAESSRTPVSCWPTTHDLPRTLVQLRRDVMIGA